MLSSPTLSEQVSRALRRSPHLSGHHLRPKTRDGHVVLHGSVSSFFQKQMAQEAVRRIDGVQQIANELIVLSDSSPAGHKAHF